MTRSDFAENAFGDPDQTTDKPIALRIKLIKTCSTNKREKKKTDPKDTDGVEGAVRRPVRFDHAEHAVKLPVDKEDDEQMVRVPEALKVGPTPLFH